MVNGDTTVDFRTTAVVKGQASAHSPHDLSLPRYLPRGATRLVQAERALDRFIWTEVNLNVARSIPVRPNTALLAIASRKRNRPLHFLLLWPLKLSVHGERLVQDNHVLFRYRRIDVSAVRS